MKTSTLSEIAQQCDGELIAGDGEALVDSVSTDTRSLAGGELFVALAGERFDAHDHLDKAAEAGAKAVVVSRSDIDLQSLGTTAVLRTDDTLAALQRLAAAQRLLLDPEVVGITGSSGKTSTKDMLSVVLGRRFSVNATKGNLNNHIGLPLTVLATTPDHGCGVWEMGMSHRGEIAPLAAIAKPDVAVITNVGVAHIEHLGSREEICEEKGDLLAALGPDGVAIFPDADDFADRLAERAPGRVLRPGIDGGEISAYDLRPTAAGGTSFILDCAGDRAEATLTVPGRHMVSNALLAAAAGHIYGLSAAGIAAALGTISLTGGRLQRREFAGGIVVLDDSYNANPESMNAALRTLGEHPCPGRRIAALGRMAELGDHRRIEHRRSGAVAAEAGIDLLCTVGVEADWIGDGARVSNPAIEHRHFEDQAACGAFLASELTDGDCLLLKGSRSSRMELVLDSLHSQPEAPAPATR